MATAALRKGYAPGYNRRVTREELIDSSVGTWRRHNDLLVLLPNEVPRGGLEAATAGGLWSRWIFGD